MAAEALEARSGWTDDLTFDPCDPVTLEDAAPPDYPWPAPL
jgi:hypothetical protein